MNRKQCALLKESMAAGYEDAPSDAVVQAILERAAKYVPGLAGLQPHDSQTR